MRKQCHHVGNETAMAAFLFFPPDKTRSLVSFSICETWAVPVSDPIRETPPQGQPVKGPRLHATVSLAIVGSWGEHQVGHSCSNGQLTGNSGAEALFNYVQNRPLMPVREPTVSIPSLKRLCSQSRNHQRERHLRG